MGRISQNRKVHFRYFPLFIAHYKEQTPQMKQLMAQIGEAYGYSAMNVFFSFFVQYHTYLNSSGTRKPFRIAI